MNTPSLIVSCFHFIPCRIHTPLSSGKFVSWMQSMMRVPGGLFLLVLLHVFTGSSSETLVTSCSSCHDEATCLESRERGDTFSHQILSCVCKEGFVGDGLTCYDTKLCSDSSCCRQGYHWSPDRGCVEDPSVKASCGGVVCPSGTDCISINGTEQCADPCEHYSTINDEWRSVDYTVPLNKCDRDVNWQGWYRMFLGQSNARIPDWCVSQASCGTAASLWIGEPHPTEYGRIFNRIVCTTFGSNCCLRSPTIQVKLCYGNYYVYKLQVPAICNSAYCAETYGASPGVPSTTDPRPQNSTTTATPQPGLPTTQISQPTPVQPPSHEIPRLICSKDKLLIGLHINSVTAAGFNPFSGNLASRNCSQFSLQDDMVWYEVDAQAGTCGNELRTNRTHAVYSNALFIYPYNQSFAVPVTLPFSCAYPLNTDSSLYMTIRPFLPEGSISGDGPKARASMNLYRDPDFTDRYSGIQVSLPVGSPLYVGVTASYRETNFGLVLEDCFATHSSNPDDSSRYPFIQNQCPAAGQPVSIIESGRSLQARFSAVLFVLQDDYRDIFLHCNLSLCDQRRYSCIPRCRSRKSRSVSSSASLEPITIGPISWHKPAQ